MQTLWMGVRPGLEFTRLLVQDGPIPILKARLPEAPHHPRALETLAEGVALWYGRPLYAALGVAAEDALCVSPRWHAAVLGEGLSTHRIGHAAGQCTACFNPLSSGKVCRLLDHF